MTALNDTLWWGSLYLLRLPGSWGACPAGPQFLSPGPTLSFIGWADSTILLEPLGAKGDFHPAAVSLRRSLLYPIILNYGTFSENTLT